MHLLAYLRQDGYTQAVAAAAAGALGIVQVAGRFVFTASARRMPAARPPRSCSAAPFLIRGHRHFGAHRGDRRGGSGNGGEVRCEVLDAVAQFG